MFTKLVGVTFKDHQDNIKSLKENQELKVIKYPTEFHDKGILVTTKEEKELGFINRKLADNNFNLVDGQYQCKVINVYGKDIKGVNIYLKFYPKVVTKVYI